MTVEGTARARLLPFPSVTFTDVRVDGAGDQPAMTVDEFSMDAELAPFLRGEVLIFDMRLVHPHARVVVDGNGRIDWAVRSSGTLDPSQVTLEEVTISGGSVDLVHQAGGRTHHLTGIEADLSARSLAGPWRIEGSASVDGVQTTLSIATGRSEPDGGMRVHVEARPTSLPFELETDGRFSFNDNHAASYGGSFRLVTRTAQAGAEAGEAADGQAKPAAGNRVSGRFLLENQRLAIDEFRFETGPVKDPYTADGKAFVDIGPKPQFSVTADGAQINFDAQDMEKEAREQGRIALDQRLASLRRFLLSIPRPSIPGTVRVNLPAIVAGDTTIRSISLTAEPAEGGWRIGSAAATLPGRTRFEGHGLLTTQDSLRFKGAIVLAVRQPSGFAAWLARDVDEAIRRLPAAGFSADVDLGPEKQSFDKLELILGDARFRGSMIRRAPANARPSMSVKLSGDKLDLDGMAAFASLFVSDEGVTRLADHDIELDIKAGPVSAAGLSADTLDTALRLQGGTLEIDRLKIDGLAGAAVSATGTVKDFATAPSGKLDASVVSVDLEPLVSALARRFPQNRLAQLLAARARSYPGLLEDAEVDVIASAASNDDGSTGLALSANGDAGGTGFSLSASGNGRLDGLRTAPFLIDFTAHNDEAAAVYALLGLPALPLGLAGAATTELSFQGSLDQGARTRFVLAGNGLKVAVDGTAELGGERPAFSGHGTLAADDLEPWLAAAGVALPGFGYGLPTRLSSPLDLHQGRLSFGKIDGSVAASAVSANLVGELRDGKPHLTGSLGLKTLDLALPAAMVVGNTALSVEPGARWPEKPFEKEQNAPFSADAKLTVDQLYFGRAVLAGKAQMDFTLDKDGLRIANFKGARDGGALSGTVSLRNNGGSALMSGQIKLEGADFGEALPGRALAGNGDLSGSITANGKSIAALVASLSGSGSASLRDLTVAGFNPDAFAPIVARADEIGHDIKAADTAGFAPGLVRGGRFQAGSADIAFTVAGGVLRTPPLQLKDGKTTLTADARIDLAARQAEIKGSLEYDPGLEAVTGSDPVVQYRAAGPIGAMTVNIDTQPLAQYLTQRALEREEARVEHMQAVLLEKQRLRREAVYYERIDDARRQADEERHHFAIEGERMRDEAARRAKEEAEKARQREEEERNGDQGAGDPGGAESATPAPPSTNGGETGTSGDDDVKTYFRAKDLTVDGLMKLLGPRK